jgi:competence protein ComEA
VLPISPQRLALYAAAALAILLIGWRSHGSSAATTYQPPPASEPALAAGSQVSVVDVTGAVRRPGVYRFSAGARVLDAVRKAGAGRRADLSGLNLAERLADGEQIVVPRRGDTAPSPAAGVGGTDSPIVHLNSATLEQLETLDGVGPALAQRIIDFRTLHAGFRSLDELDQVSGFGPARMAALSGHVAL